MDKKRVLFISQEITPYLCETEISTRCRNLPQGIMEKGKDIRIFMPKYGCINERRNQLHEVIRLSGMNMILDNLDYPLIIKVASLQPIRMQVYFIENEDYFPKKTFMHELDGEEFEFHDERAIFFCRGVLETVRKLGWAPNVVHCHGWMTAFMPLYLKSLYSEDPHFSNASTMFSVYSDGFKGALSNKVLEKLAFDGIETKDLVLKNSADADNVNQLGVQFADTIGIGDQAINADLLSYIEKSGKPILEYQEEEDLVEAHQSFYDKVLNEKGVFAD